MDLVSVLTWCIIHLLRSVNLISFGQGPSLPSGTSMQGTCSWKVACTEILSLVSERLRAAMSSVSVCVCVCVLTLLIFVAFMMR